MLVTSSFSFSHNVFSPPFPPPPLIFFFNFLFIFIWSSENTFNLDQSKFLSFGKELRNKLRKSMVYTHWSPRLNPFPKDKFYTLPIWKSLQTTISNLTKNGRKLSKQVEKTVGKGEIARYEQFLLFPQCFQKSCFPWVSKRCHGVGMG